MNKNKINLNKLKQLLVKKFDFLEKRDCVLLDVPNHRNIGDSLIWQGELELLKMKNVNLHYSSNVFTHDNARISNDAIILMHGGGNFGDLYPSSQNFRLEIVKTHPENDIIFFPQTIHYNKKKNIENDFRILREHKTLIICIRDTKSFNFIKEYFDESRIFLLPDMAFMLNFELFHNNKKSKKGLILNRTDMEAKTLINKNSLKKFFEYNNCKDINIADWPTYGNSIFQSKILDFSDSLEFKITKYLAKNKILKSLVDSQFGLKPKSSLENRIASGINFINEYDAVCSSRLHGLILSVLLNKKVLISDNSYGKSFEFYNTWLKDFDNIEFLK